MTSNRLFHFDILRITAILFVILLHIAAHDQSVNIGTFNWNIANIFNSCSRFCVPVLFMISGAFFWIRIRISQLEPFLRNTSPE